MIKDLLAIQLFRNWRYLLLERIERILRRQLAQVDSRVKSEVGILYKAKALGYSIRNGRDDYLLAKDNHHLKIRKGTSDILVFDQVIIRKEYDLLLSIIDKGKIPVKEIIDCGANVGYTSYQLSRNFPEANILAIEPDKDNYEILIENAKSLTKVKSANTGIWHRKDMLSINQNFRDGKEWSITLEKNPVPSKNNIPVNTLLGILREYSIRYVDVLKMDIEGAELEIFRKDPSLDEILKNTRIIAIELHSEYGDPGAIIERLMHFNFTLVSDKQTVFAYKNGV